jgi:hypothetical protein
MDAAASSAGVIGRGLCFAVGGPAQPEPDIGEGDARDHEVLVGDVPASGGDEPGPEQDDQRDRGRQAGQRDGFAGLGGGDAVSLARDRLVSR